MIFKKMIKKIIRNLVKFAEEDEIKDSIYVNDENKQIEEDETLIYRLWDYIKLRENTQAFHLCEVIGFDEWVDMEEIRRRIKELFGTDYKNERSLYPYIKTLVDLDLLETNNIGGRRKWRKKEFLFKVDKKKKKKNIELSVS